MLVVQLLISLAICPKSLIAAYESTDRCQIISEFDFLSQPVMRATAEHFDGDATTDRLDPTWQAQVDLLDPTRRSRWMHGSQ